MELKRDADESVLDRLPALREPYAKGWRRWERDGYKPERIPDRLRTEAVSSASRSSTMTPHATMSSSTS